MIKHSPGCRCSFCIPVYQALRKLEEAQCVLEKVHGTRMEDAHVAAALHAVKLALRHLIESIDLF